MKRLSSRFDISTGPVRYMGSKSFFTDYSRKIIYGLVASAFIALGWYTLKTHFENKDLKSQNSQLEQTVNRCTGGWEPKRPKPMPITEINTYKPKQEQYNP